MKKSLIILFSVSIVYALIFMIFKPDIMVQPNTMFFINLGYMWIPGILTLFLMRREKLSLKIFARPRLLFYLMPLLAIAICLATLLVSLPFGTFETLPVFAEQSLSQNFTSGFLIVLFAYVAGLTINMLASLGEELYWRGYFFEKIKKQGALKALAWMGGLWGLWQIPMVVLMGFHYPGSPILGAVMIFLLSFCLNPLLLYFRLKGKALMIPAALHGTFMATAPFILGFFSLPNRLIIGPTGFIGVIVLVLVSLGFKLHKEKTWKKIL